MLLLLASLTLLKTIQLSMLLTPLFNLFGKQTKGKSPVAASIHIFLRSQLT